MSTQRVDLAAWNGDVDSLSLDDWAALPDELRAELERQFYGTSLPVEPQRPQPKPQRPKAVEPLERRVLDALRQRADECGQVQTTRDELAKSIGLSVLQVKSAIQRLQMRQAVRRTSKGGHLAVYIVQREDEHDSSESPGAVG